MTACTNNGGKARRVVTAALVGVLSVGTVPMAALAEGVSDGIQTMAAEWYTDAKVTVAQDGQGGSVSDPSNASFKAGTGRYLKPTTLVNSMNESVSIDTDNYVYKYYQQQSNKNYTLVAASDGSGPNSVKNFFATATAGNYYVTVTSKADSTEVAGNFYFKLVDEQNLEGVYAYVGDASDKEIMYNGTDLLTDGESGIQFADSEGNPLTVTNVIWKHANGEVITAHDSSVTVPGNYVANIETSEGDAIVSFTVDKLDLAKVALSLNDSVSLPTGSGDARDNVLSAILSNARLSSVTGDVAITSVVNPDGGAGFNGSKGEYAVTIEGTDAGNVTGSATVKFSLLDTDVFSAGAVVKYGNRTMTTPFEVFLNDGESFDASKVSVEYNGKTYSGDQLEISFTKNSKTVDASELANQGNYGMTVRLKPTEDFAKGVIGGKSTSYSINIKGSSLSDKNLGFYLDGELAGNDGKVVYDGTDQLDKLDVVVKNAEGETMTEGTDYDLKVTKGGKEVSSIVDADSGEPYIITVDPKTFEFSAGTDNSFELTVKPVTIADGSSITGLEDLTDVAYTGSAIDVKASYAVRDADGKLVKDADGNQVYAELPSDVYNVVSIKKGSEKVSEIKDATASGEKYTVTIALSDAAKGNYVLSDSSFDVTVKEYGHFADVKPESWYAQVVEKAWDELYINGISGTNMFAPEAQITRADVACILFNMAGGTSAHGNNEFQFNESTGYVTGFNDVDGKAYYAQAIAWAHASGVVNGYDGNFRPTDKVTREEFAAMLANFAKVKGDYAAPSAGALDGVSDASTVSDWAKESVAWAVENGIMGNGGYVAGQSSIIRAEVAAMAVNYQPENLTGAVRPVVNPTEN